MKKLFSVLFGVILLTSCGGNGGSNYLPDDEFEPDPEPEQSEFAPYASNHDSTQINYYISTNGTSRQSYVEINGTYGYYNCKEYTYYGSSSIEYYAEYSLYRVVIRSGSDLAMTTFSFQRFNSTNSGMLMNVNGSTFTTTIRIDDTTYEANSPYSFVNTGLYQLNKFSCQYGGVILTN